MSSEIKRNIVFFKMRRGDIDKAQKFVSVHYQTVSMTKLIGEYDFFVVYEYLENEKNTFIADLRKEFPLEGYIEYNVTKTVRYNSLE